MHTFLINSSLSLVATYAHKRATSLGTFSHETNFTRSEEILFDLILNHGEDRTSHYLFQDWGGVN